MRLTLRTLLAYMDDVLDPTDAEAIAARIGESEFAGRVMQRIRSALRRLRLEAPKVDGRGMGDDPNTVAEYLDSEMAGDLVPQYERICLESDKHLAEAAACHQVLALVLQNPAQVDPALRQRIYRIGSGESAPSAGAAEAAQAVVAAPSTQETAPADEPPPAADATARGDAEAPTEEAAPSAKESLDESQAPRRKLEVPDYLKEGDGISLWPIAITLALAFLLTAGVIFLMGPLDGSHPLLAWMGESPQVEPKPEEPREPEEPTEPSESPSDAVGDPEEVGAPRRPVADDPLEEPIAPLEPKPPIGEPPLEPGADPGEPIDNPTMEPMEELEEPLDEPVPPVAPEPETPAPDEVPGATADVGRYISEDEVLARFDPESGMWRRAQPRAVLQSGDRLLVFPTYRPQLLLSGVQLTVDGPAELRLGPLDDRGAPRVALPYGKATVYTVGAAGARIHLDLAGRGGSLVFADADSAVALEVQRQSDPGVDPAETPSHRLTNLFVTSGAVAWEPDGEPAINLAAGKVLRMVDGLPATTATAEEMPPWIGGGDLPDIDRRASREVRKYLGEDRPLSTALKELAEDRRVEMRALAVRSLAQLGHFESIPAVLNDDQQRSYWSSHVDTLRATLARDPEAAAAIRETLSKAFDVESGDLYRMLWGYTDEQLTRSEARNLVAALEHPDLAHRVLAADNLRRITGYTLLYRPELSESRRRASIQKWKEKLTAGEIRHRGAAAEPPRPPLDPETPPVAPEPDEALPGDGV